ncbi:hypothetical protein BC835DRAFT_1422315 [Cytidiella melzeri]|nr:hypothetical protein BC835DRAFT_1422315 [Cytidiella melzeri]
MFHNVPESSIILTDVEILSPISPEDFARQSLSDPAPKRNRKRTAIVKDALLQFRDSYWRKHYVHSGFPSQTLFLDAFLTTLSAETKIKTLDDLKLALPDWTFAEELGPDALACIQEADLPWIEKHEAEKRNRATVKKAKTASEKPAKKMKEHDDRYHQRENKRIANGGKPRKKAGDWEVYSPPGDASKNPPSYSMPSTPHRSTPCGLPVPVGYYTCPTTPAYLFPLATPPTLGMQQASPIPYTPLPSFLPVTPIASSSRTTLHDSYPTPQSIRAVPQQSNHTLQYPSFYWKPDSRSADPM